MPERVDDEPEPLQVAMGQEGDNLPHVIRAQLGVQRDGCQGCPDAVGL